MTERRRPTLSDVARHAGVSTAVVSYVINDGPRPVAATTRERIEQSIRELGYRRDPIASALSAGQSSLVGLLIPDTANGFFGELSRQIEGEARRRGLTTMLGNTGYDAEIARAYTTAFSDLRPRGILMTAVAGDVEVAESTPLVYVHAAPEHSSRPSVIFDDREGARVAVRHLIEVHGFEDIHCVTGAGAGPARRRQEGWSDAMTEAGLATDGRVHVASFDRVEAEAAAIELLASTPLPRAVFAATDEQALAVVRTARRQQLRVPEDIAVVGFDGIREALVGSVHLATVVAPLGELARCALDLLTAPDEAPLPQHVVVRTRFQPGETCGCSDDLSD